MISPSSPSLNTSFHLRMRPRTLVRTLSLVVCAREGRGQGSASLRARALASLILPRARTPEQPRRGETRRTRSVMTRSRPSVKDLLEISRWTSFPQFSESELVSCGRARRRAHRQHRSEVHGTRRARARREARSTHLERKRLNVGVAVGEPLEDRRDGVAGPEASAHDRPSRASARRRRGWQGREGTHPVSPSSDTLSQISRNFSQLTSVSVSAVPATGGGVGRASTQKGPSLVEVSARVKRGWQRAGKWGGGAGTDRRARRRDSGCGTWSWG